MSVLVILAVILATARYNNTLFCAILITVLLLVQYRNDAMNFWDRIRAIGSPFYGKFINESANMRQSERTTQELLSLYTEEERQEYEATRLLQDIHDHTVYTVDNFGFDESAEPDVFEVWISCADCGKNFFIPWDSWLIVRHIDTFDDASKEEYPYLWIALDRPKVFFELNAEQLKNVAQSVFKDREHSVEEEDYYSALLKACEHL